MSQDILEHRPVIGSVSYVWSGADDKLVINDIDDDELDEFVEQLYLLKFSQDAIAACVAARLGASELEATADFDELNDGTKTVFVFIRADGGAIH